jgi:hypothetical protein
MKKLFRVVAQTPVVSVPAKEDGTQTSKCTLMLQELGGKYENSYAVTVFGNAAQCQYPPGEILYGVLRFQTHEYNGQWYQDTVAKELLPININH